MTVTAILNKHFQKKKKTGYSMRALARDLDISPAFVSSLFSGKKKLPLKMVKSICKRLDIDSETALEIQKKLLPASAALMYATFDKENATYKWQEADKRTLSALRQWFYVAILELVTCKSYDGTVAYIARRLKLSTTSVEVAIRELQALGLISLQEGQYLKSTQHLKISVSKSIHEIRNFHRQMLRKAEEELKDVNDEDYEKRLIMGITVSASVEKIAIAKKMLSDSLHEIANFLSDDKGDEVYHLAGQLFSLTKN